MSDSTPYRRPPIAFSVATVGIANSITCTDDESDTNLSVDLQNA